jgi:flagellar motor switch protein FliG
VTTTAENPIRKAAVFVRALEPEAAATLLARLSAEEASRLRLAIAELGAVDARERSSVADEALRHTAKRPVFQTAGVELVLDSSAGQLAIPRPEQKLTAGSVEDPSEWFAALKDEDASAVASYLSDEQPRAVALVLSQVPATLAAAVLEHFEEDYQGTILDHLTTLGDADPSTVRMIASGLADWVRQQQAIRRRETDRAASVRAILSAVPLDRRRRLATRLRDPRGLLLEEEPEAVAKPVADRDSEEEAPNPLPIELTLERPLVAYDELERLDDRAIALALGTLDPRTAMLSLVAAREGLLRRVEARLTKSAARELRRRLTSLHQTSLAEIDAAQRALATAASRIVEQRQSARAPYAN